MIIKEFGDKEVIVAFKTANKTYWEYGTYKLNDSDFYKQLVIMRLKSHIHNSVLKDSGYESIHAK